MLGTELGPGHNGGVREQLVPSAAPSKPHIVFVLVDDFGEVAPGLFPGDTDPNTPPIYSSCILILIPMIRTSLFCMEIRTKYGHEQECGLANSLLS